MVLGGSFHELCCACVCVCQEALTLPPLAFGGGAGGDARSMQADKAGLGRFGPGIEVLAGVNGTAMFGTDGDGVAKQMRSRSTLVQLTVVTNDDFADHLLSSMGERTRANARVRPPYHAPYHQCMCPLADSTSPTPTRAPRESLNRR